MNNNKKVVSLYEQYVAKIGYTPEELTVSRENKKLKPNKDTAFIIWNLPSVITCPNRTALCEKFCYAKKAETAYPDCLPSRKRHLKEAIAPDFAERMTATILKIAKGTKKKHIIVRIHESGDFFNQVYADKWLLVMDNCKADKRIKFIAYTKSFRFFDGKVIPKNFALRASVWSDTKESDLQTIARNNWNIYTAVDKFQTGDKFTRCRCSDCASCGKCWKNYKDIRCEIH